MINRYPYKNIIWIDLEKPTQEEIATVTKEFKLDPTIAADLLLPTPRQKAEVFRDAVYAIFHFPVFKHSHDGDSNKQEVDFIIGKNFLITARYDTIDPIHHFAKTLEVENILNKFAVEYPVGFVFLRMMKEIYKSLLDELAFMQDWLDNIESRIFEGKEKEMVAEISRVGRNLLDFKRTISFHRDLLQSVELIGKKVFGEEFATHVESITDDYYKIYRTIMSDLEFVIELRETNNSLLNSKQNEIMKVLTIMAFVTFPLSLIAAIFGMNTSYIPFVGGENDFWVVIGIMSFATICMFAFFKSRKWL